MLFNACGDTDFEYSNHPAHLVFDNTASRSTKLAEAMNPVSPGIFCHIRTSGKAFLFETNTEKGKQERVVFDAKDERVSIQLGVYNESGIIVGFGNLNNPATFYAYDNQCPNCYKQTGMPQYPLTMDASGKARCGKCGRSYDMNNGGIVSAGDAGEKLIRYRASTAGPFGVLIVNNG